MKRFFSEITTKKEMKELKKIEPTNILVIRTKISKN